MRKGLGLTFRVAHTDVPPPYETEWTIQNEGDEAKDARTLVAAEVCPVKHTSTMYKGRQKMICSLKKNGETVAQAEHVVRIAGGWFGRG